MTIQEIEQRLEVMEQVAKAYGIFKEEVEQLQKALAELKESKKEGKWKPEKGENYWFRDSFGNNIGETSTDCHIDRWRGNHMIIFPTKEECERYWHFMDTVKEKSYEFSELDWKNGEIKKWLIAFDYEDNKFFVDDFCLTKFLGKIYFKTKADAQYIIDNFKDELMEFFIRER